MSLILQCSVCGKNKPEVEMEETELNENGVYAICKDCVHDIFPIQDSSFRDYCLDLGLTTEEIDSLLSAY